MEFEITHTTQYRYGHPAAEAYGEARLVPPERPSQRVLSHSLEIDPQVQSSAYTDHFGNHVDFFSLPFRHDHLRITSRVAVRTQSVEPPRQSLEQTVQEVRQILGSSLTDVFEFLQPTSAVPTGREALSWSRKYLGGKTPLGVGLQNLVLAIHDNFSYRPGSTENSTALAEVWKNKEGVCQDFAHIGLSILRTAGVPARYVCGYIEAYAPESRARLTGAIATHAWIEVLVPGLQWVAIDPTNRQWANERYVAVSFGRDCRDATPLRGTFKGSGGQVMKVRVHVKRRRDSVAA